MIRRTAKLVFLLCLMSLLLVPPRIGSGNPEEKGPALDRIIIEARDPEAAIEEVANGVLDCYLEPFNTKAYQGIPKGWLENLKPVKTTGLYWSICVNPVHDENSPYIVTVDGVEYFNPFAIRECRYALNFLINRKHLIDEFLAGGGAPMYSAVRPSNPSIAYVEDIYAKHGLTPAGDQQFALQMIGEAMNEAAAQSGSRLKQVKDASAPAGYWWYFDGEPVTVNFLMRVEDERHEEGLYVEEQIEKAGITVRRNEGTFGELIPVVFYTDPKDYEWNLYTGGWVTRSDSKWVEGLLSQMYCPWLGWMPGYQEPGWWQYTNEALDELGRSLYFGTVEDAEEYWSKFREIVDLGIGESVRVFTVENHEYFPVNERVNRMIHGTTSGLWSPWSLRTADTLDHVLRAALEEASPATMYAFPWNPLAGRGPSLDFVWKLIVDSGSYCHPWGGEPVPYRVDWNLEKGFHWVKGDREGKIGVPADAVLYNSFYNTWHEVGSGVKACAKATYDLKLSNFHHGMPQTMDDVRYAIAHMYEWAHPDDGEDPKYDPGYASGLELLLDQIRGFEFVDEDTVVVYGDYLHPASDRQTLSHYLSTVFPILPWEVWEAMDQVIVNGGPVSGDEYTYASLSLIDPAHVGDMCTSLVSMWASGSLPEPLESLISVEDARERYAAAAIFALTYDNLVISSGPFVLVSYDPEGMRMELEAFRDPTYPFTPDHWYDVLRLYPVEELERLKEQINELRSRAFDKKPKKRKQSLCDSIDDVQAKVLAEDYKSAVTKLENEIRARMDGDPEKEDWIVDPEAQAKLCGIIDRIIAYIQMLEN